MRAGFVALSCLLCSAGYRRIPPTVGKWHKPLQAAEDCQTFKAFAKLLLAKSPTAAFDTTVAFGGQQKPHAYSEDGEELPTVPTGSESDLPFSFAPLNTTFSHESFDDPLHPPLTIVVTGATGKVGSMLTYQLLQNISEARSNHTSASLRVIVLVRNAAKAHAIFGDAVEVMEADYTDLYALNKELGRKNLSQWRMFLACGNTPQQGYAELNLLAAAGAHGCEYVVKLSTVRTVLESELSLGKVHLESEAALLSSRRIKYKTILRPNLFMQSLLRGSLACSPLMKSTDTFEHPFANTQISMVDIVDVAAVAGKLLTSVKPSKYNRWKIDLTGPAAVTVADIANEASRYRPRVFCKTCSIEKILGGVMPTKDAESFIEVLGASKFVSKNVHKILRRPARSAAEFVYESREHFLPERFEQLVGKEKSLSFRAGTSVVKPSLAKAMSEVKSNQVFLKVLVAGVNAVEDTFRVESASREISFPLGHEGVGQVVAVGQDVADFAVGDLVSFVEGYAYSEYTSVNAAQCQRINRTAPLAEYVAFRVSALTASVALHQIAGIQQGDVVLITAACGASGSFAVQLAKLAGATVIGAVGRADKVAAAKKLGCDRVVDYRTEDLDAVLKHEFPGGIDIVYEGVGGSVFKTAYDHLNTGGRILLVGDNRRPTTHTIKNLGDVMEIFRSKKTVELPGSRKVIGNIEGDASSVTQERNRVQQLHAEGKLRALIIPAKFNGIASIPDAVDYMLRGENVGKVWVQCSV